MIHSGIVKSICSSKAEVVVSREQGSAKCAGCGSCGKAGKEFSVTVEVGASVRVGDAVKLDLEFPNQALNAILVFGLPLIFMLAGGFGAHRYWASDAAFVIGFFGGLVVGFGVLYLANAFLSALHIKARFIP